MISDAVHQRLFLSSTFLNLASCNMNLLKRAIKLYLILKSS